MTPANNAVANTAGLPCIAMRRGPAPLPPFELPEGIRLFPFLEPGGAAVWEHIVNTAFGREMSFDRTMRSEDAFRPERVIFLARGDQPVAVAAAWQRAKYPAGTGYLHYVGVLPEARGQALGYWVSLAALHQMRREGNELAVLETHDERIPAIKTYLKLGFVPDMESHPSYPARWEAIMAQINTDLR